MNVLLPLAAVVALVAATSSRKKPASPAIRTGGVGTSPECGPYGPLANGWRPICVSHTGPRFTSLTVPSRVVLWIQQGVRGQTDESNMAVVEGEVVSVNAGASQPLYNIRLVRVIQSFNETPDAILPPTGTLFSQVRPQFIDTLDVLGTVASFAANPPAVAVSPGGGSSSLAGLGGSRGAGGGGDTSRPPSGFPGEPGYTPGYESGLINNPDPENNTGIPLVAGWRYGAGAGVGGCGGNSFPGAQWGYNPYAAQAMFAQQAAQRAYYQQMYAARAAQAARRY